MFSNVTSLTGVSSWARGSGLEIALLVIGTILAPRAAALSAYRRIIRLLEKSGLQGFFMFTRAREIGSGEIGKQVMV
jgi:hypothetical protein